MAVTRMGELRKIRTNILRGPWLSVIRPVILEFAIEVRGPHRMDRAAMNMSRFSVTVIRIGMHVEQGHHEHPQSRP